MTLDEAIADLRGKITTVYPDSVVRVMRVSDEEASIRVYAPASYEEALKDATRDQSIALLTREGLDVQVFVYDIATSLPPEE